MKRKSNATIIALVAMVVTLGALSSCSNLATLLGVENGKDGKDGVNGINGADVVYMATGNDVGLMGALNDFPITTGGSVNLGMGQQFGFFSISADLGTPKTLTGLYLVNRGTLQFTLSGQPRIREVSGSFKATGADFASGDSVPEISVSPITDTTLTSNEVYLSFTITNVSSREGTFRKRYRIELQDAENQKYNYDFEVEAVINS